jgi:plastocyanin
MRHWKIVALVAAAASLAACGGSSGASSSTNPGGTGNPPPPPAANLVTLRDSLFAPATMTISKGATVTWYWNDCGSGGYGYGGTGCIQHSVVFDDGSNGSALQDSGTFVRTFSTAGTFKYHCGVHGAAMTGQVIVN